MSDRFWWWFRSHVQLHFLKFALLQSVGRHTHWLMNQLKVAPLACKPRHSTLIPLTYSFVNLPNVSLLPMGNSFQIFAALSCWTLFFKFLSFLFFFFLKRIIITLTLFFGISNMADGDVWWHQILGYLFLEYHLPNLGLKEQRQADFWKCISKTTET